MCSIINAKQGACSENCSYCALSAHWKTGCAAFRFIMPDQVIRCAAGRKSLGKNGRDAFMAGINALISGDFLTMEDSTNEEDLQMLAELGYEF